MLPGLVMEAKAGEMGYGRATVSKFVACGVLKQVKPPGARQAKYQKKQLAHLLEWGDLIGPDEAAFRLEPPLLGAKAVRQWTGWCDDTLAMIVRAKGLTFKKPPGAGKGKFLKREIAGLIGFEGLV